MHGATAFASQLHDQRFVARQTFVYGAQRLSPGDPVPDGVPTTTLRAWLISQLIGHANGVAPQDTGRASPRPPRPGVLRLLADFAAIAAAPLVELCALEPGQPDPDPEPCPERAPHAPEPVDPERSPVMPGPDEVPPDDVSPAASDSEATTKPKPKRVRSQR